MQLLRVTRNTDESPAVGPLCVAGIAFIVCLVMGFVTWGSGTSYAFFSYSALMGCALARVAWSIRFPYEMEIVMEEDRIRYGRSNRPGSQKVWRRDRIKVVHLDENVNAPSLSLGIGRWGSHRIPLFVLPDLEKMREVVRGIREHWPEVEVRVKGGSAGWRF